MPILWVEYVPVEQREDSLEQKEIFEGYYHRMLRDNRNPKPVTDILECQIWDKCNDNPIFSGDDVGLPPVPELPTP